MIHLSQMMKAFRLKILLSKERKNWIGPLGQRQLTTLTMCLRVILSKCKTRRDHKVLKLSAKEQTVEES